MSSLADWLDQRVDRSRATLGLFVGDVAAITLFVVLGELSHNINPITAATYVLTNTLSPFLLGWVLVAIPLGMYGAATREPTRRVALRTAGAWLGADAIAQAIRATPYIQGGSSLRAILVFGLVSFLVGGGLLVSWRVGTSLLRSRRQSTVPA